MYCGGTSRRRQLCTELSETTKDEDRGRVNRPRGCLALAGQPAQFACDIILIAVSGLQFHRVRGSLYAGAGEE